MADIVQLKEMNETTLVEVNSLLKQFRDGEITSEQLQKLLKNPASELWTAVEGGVVVGMATLVIIEKLAGASTRIEDVVVDEVHRGKGLGKALCQKLIDRSKELGAYAINLTSRPDRVVANALYQKLGFEQRSTNVYRLEL